MRFKVPSRNEPRSGPGHGGEGRDVERGRVPPGQYVTERFPVLHYGPVPSLNRDSWDFRIWGLVEEEKRWTFDQFRGLPTREIVVDIHCVTGWSKLDTRWEGVSIQEVLSHVRLKPEARFALIHAEGGFTTNLSLQDLRREENLLAWRYNGEELTPVPLLLEVGQVGARHRVAGQGPPRVLGELRLS